MRERNFLSEFSPLFSDSSQNMLSDSYLNLFIGINSQLIIHLKVSFCLKTGGQEDEG
jgi:hypothetical protein